MRAQVFGAVSVTHFRHGHYREAITWGQRALAAARRTGDQRSIAYAHNMLANALVAEASLSKAAKPKSEDSKGASSRPRFSSTIRPCWPLTTV